MKRYLWRIFLYSFLCTLTFLDTNPIYAKDDSASEVIDPQSVHHKLTVRCYEFCGIYTDITFEGERKPTWTDLKASLQSHYNNFKDVLLVNRNCESIQNNEDAIPEIYFKKLKDNSHVLYFYFGDPFRDYIKELRTEWDRLQKK